PRVLFAFEDEVLGLPEDVDPSDDLKLPLHFTWSLPPLESGPDLLVLATELAGVGGPSLPLEVSAMDTYAAVTDAPQRTVTIIARVEIPLANVYRGDEQLFD